MTDGTASAVEDVDQARAHQVVSELRASRRRRRLGSTDWFELAYRVYTTAFVTLVVTIMLSGWVGNSVAPVESVQRLVSAGPQWAGLGLAALMLLAVRSGSRAGPISLEGTDVHHLLLSPARRGATLRRPSAEVIGYGVLAGVLVGGVVGSFFSQRVPGGSAEWVASGALFGSVAMAVAVGAALLTSSRILPVWVPAGLAWTVVLWAVADVAGTGPTAPTTFAGALLFLPISGMVAEPAWTSAPWGLVAVLLPAAGTALIGGLSIEQAGRRTELVTQLRFAVTVQDLRSVILLRRQLAAETPRNRSWFPVPRRLDRLWPVFARDLRSVAHWPPIRIARVFVLCVAAALAVRGVFSGNTPLFAVAGVASFVAALDVTEPLSQDVDHPLLQDSLPVEQGRIMVRHLAQPTLMMIVTGLAAMAVVWALSPSPEVISVGIVILGTAPAAAVAGAAVSSLSGVETGSSSQLMTPEVAGPRLVIRTAGPPLVATAGFLPALAAANADPAVDPSAAAGAVALPVFLLVVGLFGWVRFRPAIHAAMAEATGVRGNR